MNLYKKYEVFILKTESKDKISVIIAGMCNIGMKNKVIEQYIKINEYDLNKSKDIFLIDYTLAEVICELAKEGVLVAGASVKIDGVDERTGGIIGNPFDEVSSADGEIEEVNKEIFVVSSAGSPGVAFRGLYADALKINNYLKQYEFCSQEDRIKEVYKMVKSCSDTFVIVSDGTGAGSVGKVVVSDFSGEYLESFKNI